MFMLIWVLVWLCAWAFTDRNVNMIEEPIWLFFLILAVWLDTD